MIDIVLPLGYGSKHRNIEIMYCLRAIERHLTNYGDIFIIGQRPTFINWGNSTHIYHIPATDNLPAPDFNICNKIKIACETPHITDEFLFFNDDHFLLQDFDATTFPFYYQGTLTSYVLNHGEEGYARRVNNSLKLLTSKGLPERYYDVHTPIRYEKRKFMDNVIPLLDLRSPKGMVIKSLYGNTCTIDGEETTDTKLIDPPGPDVKILSTFTFIMPSVLRFLSKLFPNKSKYEH